MTGAHTRRREVQGTTAIVVFCPRCDYFLKTAVEVGHVGTHGCIDCMGNMEVYVPQELAAPEWQHSHTDPGAHQIEDSL